MTIRIVRRVMDVVSCDALSFVELTLEYQDETKRTVSDPERGVQTERFPYESKTFIQKSHVAGVIAIKVCQRICLTCVRLCIFRIECDRFGPELRCKLK